MKKAFLFFIIAVLLPCNITISQNYKEKTVAVGAKDFLNSMGVVSSISRRGETVQGTIECIKYTGLHWIRAGYEDNAPVEDFLQLHKQTGVLISYGLLSGNSDTQRLIKGARQLALGNALLALEGANEPNNWGITYKQETGGRDKSWLPVAKLQRDLYNAAKDDAVLKKYPVWSISENGAQTDNVGLQYLIIPENAGTSLPAGTQFADYANCHNYICHPSWPGIHNNQTWQSSDPTKACPIDGLYGNCGVTWKNKQAGYSEKELLTLPRVTTETGISIDDKNGITEELQACMYLNLYLSQYKRGWKYTAIYLLKGRSNEPAHESFAFYDLKYKPKLAAHYLHNFTTILSDDKSIKSPGKLGYAIQDKPTTVHDMLLQKSNGLFELVIWGERFKGGTDKIRIRFEHKLKEVRIYDPTVAIKAINKFRNVETLPLSMSNHPLIIEIEI